MAISFHDPVGIRHSKNSAYTCRWRVTPCEWSFSWPNSTIPRASSPTGRNATLAASAIPVWPASLTRKGNKTCRWSHAKNTPLISLRTLHKNKLWPFCENFTENFAVNLLLNRKGLNRWTLGLAQRPFRSGRRSSRATTRTAHRWTRLCPEMSAWDPHTM